MKVERRFASSRALLVAVTVAACDGRDATSSILASQFCAQALEISAALNARCQTGATADWLGFFSTFTHCANLDALVAKGTVRYHRDQAAACLASLSATRACDGVADFNGCYTKVVEGTRAVGASCTDDAECPWNAPCFVPGSFDFNTCATAVCTHLPTVAGDSCADLSVCLGNLTCLDGTCKANLGAGATCNDTTPSCSGGLTCGPAGSCVPIGMAGDACLSDSDCPGALFCSNNKCAARVTIGGACDPVVGGCIHFAICDVATSTCVSASHFGELCDNYMCIGGLCGGPAGAETCNAPGDLGDTCTVGGECLSRGCQNGICATCP